MPYANPADRRANLRKRYALELPFRERLRAATRTWTQKNPERQKEYQRVWRAANPEKRKASSRRGRFLQTLKKLGWTEAGYNEMWNMQGHICAACGSDKTNFKKGWTIDHNHETGKIRGIVCPGCNLIAGHARDDTRRLRLIALYLERTGG